MRARAICGVLVFVVVSACKPAAGPGAAGPKPSQRTFVVTFAPTRCEVSGPCIDRRAMSCREVVDYVVRELKLSTDAPFDVATIPDGTSASSSGRSQRSRMSGFA